MKRVRGIEDFFNSSSRSKQPRDETEEHQDRPQSPSGTSPVRVMINSEPLERASDTCSESVPESSRQTKRNFQPRWLNEFSWLRYENGAMTCSYCSAFPAKAGSTEFAKGCVTTFKRETVTAHGKSKRHISCRDSALGMKRGATIQVGFETQEAVSDGREMVDLLGKINTAYAIAKEELPFTKFRPLLDLQRKNGLELSQRYAWEWLASKISNWQPKV